MTGLEALNKFVNIFAEYVVKTQHQYLNATNMQTAVEYLARSEECRTIEKSLKALEIIKEKRVNVGTFIHLTKVLKKDYEKCKGLNNTFGANICDCEFLTEEQFNLLKEVLK
jgi:3-methyladenine DNA glycosylase Tag